MEKMVIKLETGEVNLNDKKIGNCITVNCKEVSEDKAEVILYRNADMNSPFYFVMETDLISDDFLDTETNPIKYAIVL